MDDPREKMGAGGGPDVATPGPPEQPGKLVTLEALADLCRWLHQEGRTVVLCHGCFDLLHIGHIRYFRQARRMGDVLVVTVSPDRYVDKGPHRPAFDEQLRAEAVASLDTVDFVAVNQWPTAEPTLALLRPDLYVKGADFKSVEADKTGKLTREAEVCRELGIELRFTEDLVFSSTSLINRFFSSFSQEMRECLRLFRRRYSLGEILDVVARMAALDVVVTGDVIIDEYCYCHPLGTSSKSPVLAVGLDTTDVFAGGVLAVANHLAGFAGRVRLLSVIGERDDYRPCIDAALKPNVHPSFWVQRGAPTLVKRRMIDGASLSKLFEVYVMDDSGLDPATDAALTAAATEAVRSCDLAVCADFGHGAISPALRRALAREDVFLAVNTQANAGNGHMHTISRYERADLVSLTERELRLDARDSHTDLRPLVCDTVKRFNSAYVAVTRGRQGACVCTPGDSFVAIPALTASVVDSIGAGDAFFAVAALAARLGAPREIVGFLGNVAGALAVQTVGNRKAVERPEFVAYITSILG
jgi:rfaE bifunctional protein nucleotidyltransferase chain/domain